MPHNCLGVFCEDIREEVSGEHTLVGIMPDNININVPPGEIPSGTSLMFPKLGIYLRVHLDVSHLPKGDITARATIPGMAEVHLGKVEANAIEGAYKDARSKRHPIVGLIFKSVLGPLRMTQSGLAVAYAKIDDREITGAMLNIQIIKSV